MYFLNVRRAFATNSSSTHSMVILEDENDLGLSDRESASGNSYGWDTFTLVSDPSKKEYLRALVGSSLRENLGENVALAVLEDMGLGYGTEQNNRQDFSQDAPIGDVDHQSRVYFPKSDDGSGLNVQFLEEFVAWAMQKHVAILGGNDNGGDHPVTEDESRVVVSWQGHLAEGNLVARKDTQNNTWSVFSKSNGLTLRLSFDEKNPVLSEGRPSETKGDRPNLVDVKITDKCPYQCAYCYQGSTPKGVHAPLDRLIDIADTLSGQGVFEVALGGGEPTIHPSFSHIVSAFDDRNIKANFTTRNINWLRDIRNKDTIEKCGGIAFSVDKVETAQEIVDLMKKEKNLKHKLKVQLVVGSQSENDFKETVSLLLENKIEITFLGYKTTGFGGAYQEEFSGQVRDAEENWMDWLLSSTNQKHLWIAIDTALAQTSDQKLQDKKISSKLYHRTEGTTSMYIDAVANTMAPSSFCEDIYGFDERWLETYQGFSEKPSKKIKAKMVM